MNDSKRRLLEAAQAAVADSRTRAGTRTAGAASLDGGRGRRRRLLVLLALGLAGATILIVQPAWLITPPSIPEPPEVSAASARIGLVREANLIRQYRLRTGQLPAGLEEVDPAVPFAIQYLATGDTTFSLTAVAGGDTLTLRSTDDVPAFLGDSWQRILTRGRPAGGR